MAKFEEQLKTAFKTEAEIGALLAGAVAANQFVADEKIFKKQFSEHPEWFAGSREGAPWYIQWSGGIKAIGALVAAGYVKNPWVKLLLMGIAFQGTLQQVRVLTWDKTKGEDRITKIGTASMLDDKLRELANRYRANGPEYLGFNNSLTERYTTAVSGPQAQSERYSTNVSGPQYIEGEWGRSPFDDSTEEVVSVS